LVDKVYVTVGRRKTSVARVRLTKGKGTITVNKRPMDEYFHRSVHKIVLKQPLEVTDAHGTYDISVNVTGGGHTGQAGAIRHGIARALVLVDEKNRGTLKRNGYLTRDSRMIERKKYGHKGARKSFQFSKR